MARRKTSMATEPKAKPPTGGGLKANPNMPLQRLSPGVYRSAGGGLVNQRGRPVGPQTAGRGIANQLRGGNSQNIGQQMLESLQGGKGTGAPVSATDAAMNAVQNRPPMGADRTAQGPGGMSGTQMPPGAGPQPQFGAQEQARLDYLANNGMGSPYDRFQPPQANPQYPGNRINYGPGGMTGTQMPGNRPGGFLSPAQSEAARNSPLYQDKMGMYGPGQSQQDFLNALYGQQQGMYPSGNPMPQLSPEEQMIRRNSQVMPGGSQYSPEMLQQMAQQQALRYYRGK